MKNHEKTLRLLFKVLKIIAKLKVKTVLQRLNLKKLNKKDLLKLKDLTLLKGHSPHQRKKPPNIILSKNLQLRNWLKSSQ